MLRRFGLRQRLMAILAAGGIVTALIVGLGLNQLSVLQGLSQAQRAAASDSDAIQEAIQSALRVATVFSSLNLDLDEDERRQAITEGDAMLAFLDEAKVRIDPILHRALNGEDWKAIAQSLKEIHHAWAEIKEEVQSGERTELRFHLVAVLQNADTLRRQLFIASQAARGRAVRRAAELDSRAVQARWIILLALGIGVLGLAAVGWLMFHFGVKRPLDSAVAAVSRIAEGDLNTPVPPPQTADEFGKILSALEFLRRHAAERMALEQERQHAIGERDARRERLEALIGAFRAAVLTALNENAAAVQSMRRATQELA